LCVPSHPVLFEGSVFQGDVTRFRRLEELSKQVKIAVVASVAMTIIMLVVWPLPMHFSNAVFAEGGFIVWVASEMLWAIVAGIVIIGLPVYETVKSFKENKKAKEAADAKSASAESCSLPDGSKLQIPGQSESVPTPVI